MKRNVCASVLKRAIEDHTFRNEVLKLPEDYFPEEYRSVVSIMKMLPEISEEIIHEQLESLGHDTKILDVISEQQSSNSNAGDLAYIIDQKNKKDLYIDIKGVLKEMNGKPYSQVLEDVRKIISTSPAVKNEVKNGSDVAKELFKNILEFKNGKKKPYLTTGMPIFDEKARLYSNKYVLLVSQKKQGKTKFTISTSLKLMENNPNVSTLYISLEMTDNEIVNGYLSAISGIEEDEIYSSKKPIDEKNINKIQQAIDKFSKFDFKIYSSPMGLRELYQVCSDFKASIPKDNIPVIIIDNIGLIRQGKKTGNEFDDEVAIALKDIRDDFNCLLIAIHHMTKSSESDPSSGYEPKVHHVRGSSRLADFCNTLIMIHRPGAYSDLVSMGDEQGVDIRNMFLVNVALQRGGQGGYIPMYCDMSKNEFKEA